MANVIDLDALNPQSATIKLGGQEYQLNPPNTEQLVAITVYGPQLTSGNSTPEQLVEIIGKLRAVIVSANPQLAEVNISPTQMFKLTDILMQMALPEELKKEAGTGSDDDPKAPQT